MSAGEPIRARADERESLEVLAKFLEAGELAFLTPAESAPLEALGSVREVLIRAVYELARGNGVLVVPVQAELTPRQAAELLAISRPYLVRLLEKGAIPSHKVGSHRRLHLTDVIAYRHARDAERRAALDRLAEESERLGIE